MNSNVEHAEPDKLPAEVVVGPVALNVPDLQRSADFYRHALGLQLQTEIEDGLRLGASPAEDALPVVLLFEQPGAQVNPRAPGLYHMAIRVPDRVALGQALLRLLQTGYNLQGASDHGVSEALYLADPDGNGIEIYRDRSRSEWPLEDGQLQMITAALDLRRLLAEAQAAGNLPEHMPAGTVIGHVHLQVDAIPPCEAFYVSVMGFDLMQRYGPSASFVSAGGYHHHIGFNTWQSRGAAPPPPGSGGLRYFGLRLPDETSLEHLLGRLRSAGYTPQALEGGWLVRDPAHNGLCLSAMKS